MNAKPNILICNDDGIYSKGIQSLIEVADEFGNVDVVAPDSPQSSMGHAISMGKVLRAHEMWITPHIKGFACSGTPADCVKLASGALLKKKPDLLLSGINHGANSSIAVVYSGTMSAAMEGAIEGIPSVGFSLANFADNADFSTAKEVVRAVVRILLEQESLPKHMLLNVNIPDIPLGELKGIKICRQAKGRWTEEFDQRVDPFGRKYYWMKGNYMLQDDSEDTDEWALRNGYASIVPVKFDLTEHSKMAFFNNLHFKL